jgi:CheY-like chemotaxis protein
MPAAVLEQGGNRMSRRKEVESILADLHDVWDGNQDLQFGQLLVRLLGPAAQFWYVEDEDLKARLADARLRGALPSEPTILIINDEAPIRLLVRVSLGDAGMRVLEAGDGIEGLEVARREQPDLILLNVMMPKLDGWRVCEQLLADPATEDIPIVFVTARRESRDKARGFDLGAVDYITEPFNPLELPGRVDRVLKHVARGDGEKLRRENLQRLRQEMEEE